MRKIQITNFGPLREVNIELDKPLQIIIGQQASGKSTLGKCIYFTRKIRDYLVDYVQQQINSPFYVEISYINFLKYLRNPFMGCFGTTKHMSSFEITYYYSMEEKRSVTISLGDDNYTIFKFSESLQKDIRGLLADAVSISTRLQGSLSSSFFEQTSFLESFRKECFHIFYDDSRLIYIPAGRNLIATIPDLIQANFGHAQDNPNKYDITQIDLITQEFIKYIKQMRNSFGSRLGEIQKNYLKTVRGEIRNRDVELASELIHSILKADYICDRDGEKLYFAEDKYVKLMFGSSGQQEILWALNILFLTILKNEKSFIVFEEPESHLFPDAQELISRLIALVIGSSNSEMILTTHSPYMLTAFNLLIYSGRVERNRVEAIVERQYRLKVGTVAAYMITEGELKDLISSKRGLIDATKIDVISEMINDRMDQLLQDSMNHK